MRFVLPTEVHEHKKQIKKVSLKFFDETNTLLDEITLHSNFPINYVDYELNKEPANVVCGILYKSGKIITTHISKGFDGKVQLQDPREIKTDKQRDIIESLPDIKKDIILVNHNHTLNGAAHSLYTLYGYLKDSGKDVLVLDTFPNEIFFGKYNVSKSDVMYYEKDAVLLYHMCKKFYKRILLFNSINDEIASVSCWFDRDSIILFSRETKDYYMSKSMLFPDFVLTERIKSAYPNGPKVQPPILSKKMLAKIDEEIKQSACIEGLDTNKITLGMCGTLTSRKNYKLFLEVAAKLPQYNFVWIGGDLIGQPTPTNFFHVPYTEYPFKYYNLLDYFVLFSEHEPFGNVVTENLYVGNKVLTFRDNIYVEHNVKDQYFEFPGRINLDNGIKHITSVAKQKKEAYDSCIGKKYVLANFSEYNPQFLEKLYAGGQKF
jgi:glycosyltransferase involved in cell wall biosynthesis